MSNTPTGMVRFRYDPGNPPVHSAEEQAAWESLKDMPDEDIDFSDIPKITDFPGFRRVSDLVPEQNKQQITLRLDADLLAFFKSTGRRYQSRINAALREYMNSHRDVAKSG
jgi:uncharacterized protein (DUF4415 family)